MRKNKLLSIILGVCLLLTVGTFGACNIGGGAGNGGGQNSTSPSVSQNYGLSEVEISVGIDETYALEVLSDKEITSKVQWESENALVATVDVDGTVTGKALGTTRVFAKIGGKKLIAVVRVIETWEILPQITLKNEFAVEGEYTFTLLKGESYTLTPQLEAENVIEGVAFTVTSESSAVSVSGNVLTGVSDASNVEINITCNYEGKAYALTAYVNVR